MQGLAVAFERPAEQDEAVVDERVHEVGMLVPGLLLAELARPVPRPAALDPNDAELERTRVARARRSLLARRVGRVHRYPLLEVDRRQQVFPQAGPW